MAAWFFRRSPSQEDDCTVLGIVKGSLAQLGGSAALDNACAPWRFALSDGEGRVWLGASISCRFGGPECPLFREEISNAFCGVSTGCEGPA